MHWIQKKNTKTILQQKHVTKYSTNRTFLANRVPKIVFDFLRFAALLAAKNPTGLGTKSNIGCSGGAPCWKLETLIRQLRNHPLLRFVYLYLLVCFFWNICTDHYLQQWIYIRIYIYLYIYIYIYIYIFKNIYVSIIFVHEYLISFKLTLKFTHVSTSDFCRIWNRY